MWETEHGPSGFDGPGGGDEVNVKDIRAILFYDEKYMSVQIMMPHDLPLEHMPEKKLKLKDLG